MSLGIALISSHPTRSNSTSSGTEQDGGGGDRVVFVNADGGHGPSYVGGVPEQSDAPINAACGEM